MKVLANWALVCGFCLSVMGVRCLFAPEAIDKEFVQVFGTILGMMGVTLVVMAIRAWPQIPKVNPPEKPGEEPPAHSKPTWNG